MEQSERVRLNKKKKKREREDLYAASESVRENKS